MGIMGKLIVGLTSLTGLAALVSESAEIKTVPEQPVWVADGVTEYTVGVHVDNTGLSGEKTDGVQWAFNNTPSFSYIDGSVSLPSSEEDFFSNPTMEFPNIMPPGSTPWARFTVSQNDGPADSNGFLVNYRFTVPSSTTPGLYHFELTDTIFSSPGASAQAHTVSYDSVQVVRDEPADLNKDGKVDNQDYQLFNGCITGPMGMVSSTGVCEEADFDKDGDVDQPDTQYFQTQFTGNELIR